MNAILSLQYRTIIPKSTCVSARRVCASGLSVSYRSEQGIYGTRQRKSTCNDVWMAYQPVR